MTTSKETCTRILEQLNLEGLRVRPMMGEFLLYFHDSLIGGLYDGQLLLKEVPGTAKYQLTSVVPYASAKRTMYHLSDLDDQALAQEIIQVTCSELSKKTS